MIDVSSRNNLDIFYFNSSVLKSLEIDAVELTDEAADYFIKN